MFNFFKSKRKKRLFSNVGMAEIHYLHKIYLEKKYETVLTYKQGQLDTEAKAVDSVKLMFHLMAASALKDESTAITIFRQIIWGNGLALYEGETRIHLARYAHMVLQVAFGEALLTMPDDIKGLKTEFSNQDEVDDFIREFFITVQH